MAAKKAAGSKRTAKSSSKKKTTKKTTQSKVARKTGKKTTKKTAKKTTKRTTKKAVRGKKAAEPNFDEIAVRAFQIWEAKGKPHGQDMINWRQAEAEIRAERGLA